MEKYEVVPQVPGGVRVFVGWLIAGALCPTGSSASAARGVGHRAGSGAERRKKPGEEICNKAGERAVAMKTRRRLRVAHLCGPF